MIGTVCPLIFAQRCSGLPKLSPCLGVWFSSMPTFAPGTSTQPRIQFAARPRVNVRVVSASKTLTQAFFDRHKLSGRTMTYRLCRDVRGHIQVDCLPRVILCPLVSARQSGLEHQVSCAVYQREVSDRTRTPNPTSRSSKLLPEPFVPGIRSTRSFRRSVNAEVFDSRGFEQRVLSLAN
jgi:hypothetical protein